jgi:hypothetical protein
MTPNPLLAALCVATALFPASPARAGAGHDHGPSVAAAHSPALPRFAAVSENFELVGVLDGRQITLYLDRAADNAPVAAADIELDLAGTKLKAGKHPQQDDAYLAELAADPLPGVLPITATVSVGQEMDLLAGELDLHPKAHAAEAPHAHAWQEYAAWGAIGIAALAAVLALLSRRSAARTSGTGALA